MSDSIHIAQGGIDRHCTPTSTCAFCAREGLWQRCEHCHVAYYCSTSCRQNHLKEHEEFCGIVKTKRLFVEQDLYSIRQLVQEGNVIRINNTGEIVLTVGRYEHPSPLLDSHDSMISPVVKVDVNATNSKKKKFRINASFSMSATLSVISERLATKIGLVFNKKDLIQAISPRCWKRDAYLPETCLTVECIDEIMSSRTGTKSANTNNNDGFGLQVAPLICPSMTVDLMLGRDWLQRFGEKACVIYGPGDHSSKIKCTSGLHIAPPWERLDCSHLCNRNTSYSDHILAVTDEDVLTRLDAIRGYPCLYNHNMHSGEHQFNPYHSVNAQGGSVSSWLDPVMTHHDIRPPVSNSSAGEGKREGNNKDRMTSSSFPQQQQNDSEQHIDYHDVDDVSGISEKEEEAEEEEHIPRSLSPLYPWEECVTPEGDVFYYNSETGESSWEMY